MTVRETLRAAYLESGLTQEEIAFRAGVSSKTLWNMLRGKPVAFDNLYAVATVLKLTIRAERS